MQKTKVFELLGSLEDREWEQFARFLASPYFNSSALYLQLVEYLRKYKSSSFQSHAEESISWPSRRDLFQWLFPDRDYDAKQLTYILSELNKLGEEFLGYERLRQSDRELQLATMESLSARGLNKGYRYLNKQLAKTILDPISSSTEGLRYQLRWLDIQEAHFERSRQRSFDLTIQRAATTLDRYYFLRRLTFACAMLDRQTIFQDQYDIQLSTTWVKHLRDTNGLGDPLIQLYFSIFQALREEEEEAHFFRLKQQLNELSDTISPLDLKDIFLFGINYCARKIRQGREDYTREALQLYRRGIEQGLLLDQGQLSPWTFTNVIKLFLRLREFNEVERFIRSYASLLPPSFRENALHYNLAELYYYTQDFERAQSELQKVAYSDLNYYLGARVLLAKIFWEIAAEESLLSLVASFTIFLKRNRKVSNELKHTYLNFCKLLHKILRIDPSKGDQLALEIKSTKPLTDRAWLLEVLNG